MTYYLSTVMPHNYMDRQGNDISCLIIFVHTLYSPQMTKRPSRRLKISVCTQTGLKDLRLNYIIVIIISHAYTPKRQKRPNTQFKTFVFKRASKVSSYLYHYNQGMILSNDFKTIFILVFIYHVTII